MKRAVLGLSVALAVVCGVVWSGAFAQGDPIKIGLIQPL